MSETLKRETPETDAAEWTTMKGGVVVYSHACRKIEIDRNRWRSVAEQAEKALRSVKVALDDPEFGLAASAHMDDALSAFDSLRKEGAQS